MKTVQVIDAGTYRRYRIYKVDDDYELGNPPERKDLINEDVTYEHNFWDVTEPLETPE